MVSWLNHHTGQSIKSIQENHLGKLWSTEQIRNNAQMITWAQEPHTSCKGLLQVSSPDLTNLTTWVDSTNKMDLKLLCLAEAARWFTQAANTPFPITTPATLYRVQYLHTGIWPSLKWYFLMSTRHGPNGTEISPGLAVAVNDTEYPNMHFRWDNSQVA